MKTQTHKQSFGKWGEAKAVEILKKKGYKILETNYRTRFGEIDIIAKDRKEFCFVEVKTRSSSNYGRGLEALTPAKKRHLYNAASEYADHKEIWEKAIRFDVVSIEVNDVGAFTYEIIKNAFEKEDGFASPLSI